MEFEAATQYYWTHAFRPVSVSAHRACLSFLSIAEFANNDIPQLDVIAGCLMRNH